MHEGIVLTTLVGLWDASPDNPLQLRAEDEDPLSLPYPEALRWFRRKKVVTGKEFERLDDDARLHAFTVSGVQDRRVLTGMHNAITRAIDEGTDFYDFIDQVDAAAAEAGRQPFNLRHMATVFDTNMAGAYSAGRYQQLMRARTSREIWVYHAILDEWTRPNHRELNGWMAPWDHPAWSSRFPPNGFRCRCSVTSKTLKQAIEEGWNGDWTPPDDTDPDTGFAQSPAMAQEGRQFGREAAAAVHRRSELLPPASINETMYNRVSSRNYLTKVYTRGLEALARSQDEQRLAVLKSALPWDDSLIAAELQTTKALNFFPASVNLAPDVLTAQVHMYSQNVWTAEAFASRIAMDETLSPVRDRLRVGTKRTVFRGYGRDWDQVEHAFDERMARRLGDAEPTAWSGEVFLELELDTAEQAAALARLVDEEYTRTGSGRPVAMSWWVPDLRFLGPRDELAGIDPERTALVWSNRKVVDDLQIVTLSSKPLDGWESRQVVINKSLAAEVMSGEVAAETGATP